MVVVDGGLTEQLNQISKCKELFFIAKMSMDMNFLSFLM